VLLHLSNKAPWVDVVNDAATRLHKLASPAEHHPTRPDNPHTPRHVEPAPTPDDNQGSTVAPRWQNHPQTPDTAPERRSTAGP
jgi:hypothetical protein